MPISCIFCNLSDFDRYHFIAFCSIPQKVIQLLSPKIPFLSSLSNWESLLDNVWAKDRLGIEGPKFLIFSLFLLEIHNSFYSKLANNDYYIDHKLIAYCLIKKLKDHIIISNLLKFNRKYTRNLSRICNNL